MAIHLAHGERLPEYMDDFASVTHEQTGDPARGHVYGYRMKRGAEKSMLESDGA